MTSHQDIESLIADIDRFLPRTGSRFPWYKPSDVAAGHRLLERLRSHLVSELQNLEAAPKKPTTATSIDTVDTVAQQSTPEVQQIVQAVTQEMNFLRTDLIEGLQVELDTLREQRDSLLREIQRLEQTRQQSEVQSQRRLWQQQITSEFSQALISSCSESLRQQLSQILANWETRLNNTELIAGEIAAEPSQSGQFNDVTASPNLLEQLQQRQINSDKLLATLDANHQAIFETLQQNLLSYQKSLSQGLENMYSLGSQGQMLLAELVTRLGQQLGREASTILSSSVQLPEVVAQTQEIAGTQEIINISERTSDLRINQQLPAFPYAGAEIPPKLPQPVDSLLEELENATDDAIESWEVQSEAITQDNSSENLDSEWEIIEGLDLEDLEVELEENSRIDTFMQVDVESQVSLPSIEEIETPEHSNIQNLNPLSGLVGGDLPASPPSELVQAQTDETASLDKQEGEDQGKFSSQERIHEIEQLYETLFGKESLSSTATPLASDSVESVSEQENSDDANSETSASDTTTSAAQVSEDDQFSQSDSASLELEKVLFEEFVDLTNPTAEVNSPQSWEALLFEDTEAASPPERNLADQENSSSLRGKGESQQESLKESESVKSITALTDLFEEMGLANDASESIAAKESMSTPKEQLLADENSDLETEDSLNQEGYMPASPEENLLATNELELEANLDILLDPNTLQQLSQDLDSFEKSKTQDAQTLEAQSLSGNDSKSPTGVPSETPDSEFRQPWPLGMSEELLAEDWEEFALSDFSDPNFTLPESTDQQIDSNSEEKSTSAESNLPQPEVREQNQTDNRNQN